MEGNGNHKGELTDKRAWFTRLAQIGHYQTFGLQFKEQIKPCLKTLEFRRDKISTLEFITIACICLEIKLLTNLAFWL